MKGTLTPGQLADLVVLSADIFTIDSAQIETTRVLMTVVDGRVAHDALVK